MKKLVVPFLFFIPLSVKSQDALFTQINSAPQFVNPAFAGFDTTSRVDMAYRLQWPKLSGYSQQFFAGYQQYISPLNAYAGIYFMHEISGPFQRSQYSFQYAQNIRLGKHLVLRPGAEISYFKRKLDWDQLTFGDMIDSRRGFIYNTADIPRKDKVSGMDYSAGLLFYGKHFYLGFSAHHLTQPNESLIVGNSALPTKFGVQAGYTFTMPVTSGIHAEITPYFYYNIQSAFNTYMGGVNFQFNRHLVIGAGYRKQDAVLMNIGYRHKFFRVIYSYDLTTSNLAGQTGGSHEISIAVFFWKHKAHKNFRQTILPI